MRSADQELIVLAAPRDGDAYYAEVVDDIFDFHIAFARQILAHDDLVLILVDEGSYADYVEALNEDVVLIAPQDDIWMRDFGLVNPQRPLMFRYTAEGQSGGRSGQRDADAVQETLAELLEEAGLAFYSSDVLNDGGNFVDDDVGRAVVSRKFLRDNELNETEARELLFDLAEIEHLAFIESDEQGGLEHADGVAAFIEPGVLLVNAYTDDPDYVAELRTDLLAGLPDVQIHELVAPYDGSRIYDEKFGSACGLYTNMLVTPNRIYLPQFGIPQDGKAIASLRQWTEKEIVPVQSGMICAMGGGVRCMSMQLRGENAARLLSSAQAPGN
ncbi:MAG: agmatine deiminase family protein [Pseudomonadota bacterium]